MKTLFRIVAFLEGVSYLLLITVGLYFKYQLGDPTYVKLLGMPHGLLFVAYIVLAFIVFFTYKNSEQWKGKDFAIILFASVIPFGTFYVERKYLYK